ELEDWAKHNSTLAEERTVEPTVYKKYFYITTVLNWRVRILAYAGDMISLSTSQLGLHRQLKKFNMYYLENALVINYMKSKEVGFGKKRKQHNVFIHRLQDSLDKDGQTED
ncbi:hypothetical protein E2320_017327, partial [Naja naja]